MSNKRSLIWDYFSQSSKNDSKVKCNLCFSMLAVKNGSTSNMTRHFKLKHPTVNFGETRKRALNVEEQETEGDVAGNNIKSNSESEVVPTEPIAGNSKQSQLRKKEH